MHNLRLILFYTVSEVKFAFDIQRTVYSVVIYSYNKTNEMHLFLQFIFGIEL